MFLEGVGDVFQEDEPEDDALILGRVHVVPQLVGSEPELGLEADGGGGGACVGVLFFGAGHEGGCLAYGGCDALGPFVLSLVGLRDHYEFAGRGPAS